MSETVSTSGHIGAETYGFGYIRQGKSRKINGLGLS